MEETRTCAHCGRAFAVKRLMPKRFCSCRCRRHFQDARRKEERAERREREAKAFLDWTGMPYPELPV